MKPHKLFICVSACNLLLWIFVAARPTKESLEKITVKEFELVDDSARRHKRSRILYLDHVEGDGCLLFDQIVAMDLEGIVCKRKDSPVQGHGEAIAILDQGEEFAVELAERA